MKNYSKPKAEFISMSSVETIAVGSGCSGNVSYAVNFYTDSNGLPLSPCVQSSVPTITYNSNH